MRKLWGVLVVCVLASNALAESDADRLFNEGRALLAKNDPKGACDKFEAAIKIDPSAAGTMLNLGLCYENLKKYATSIRWFRKAQAAAAENKMVEVEEAAKKFTVNIAPKVPTLKVEVEGPPETEIRIDGTAISATDYGQVEVDPGSHEISGRAPGKATEKQTVEVQAGTKLTVVRISVTREPLVIDRGRSRKRLALIVGAGGLVLYGVTLVHGLHFGGVQQDRVDLLGEAATGDEEYESAKRQLKFGTTSMFIAGTAAVGVAAFLYFTAPGKESVAQTAFSPYVTGDQAGFAVSGAF